MTRPNHTVDGVPLYVDGTLRIEVMRRVHNRRELKKESSGNRREHG